MLRISCQAPYVNNIEPIGSSVHILEWKMRMRIHPRAHLLYFMKESR